MALEQPFIETLNRLVIDENKIVTAAYLLRHTPLNAVETQKLLEAFLDANEPNSHITASYYLLGTLKEPYKKYCTIVRKEDLEKAKQQLAKIQICRIFSVQAFHVKCMDTLFNADYSEDEDGEDPSLFKGFLRNEEAEKAYGEWHTMAAAEKKLPEQMEGVDEEKGIAIKLESTDQCEREDDEASIETQEEKLLSPKKKRGPKRILIESDDEENENAHPSNINKELETDDVTSKPKEQYNDGDDIFCTGDSDGEMIKEIENCEKRHSPAKKRSQCDKRVHKKKSDTEKEKDDPITEKNGEKGAKNAKGAKGSEGSIVAFAEKSRERKNVPKVLEEQVTETFVDEDGMLVTRTITKTIENHCIVDNQESTNPSSSTEPIPRKSTANNIIDKPKSTKTKLKASTGGKQTNLLSFFKR